MSSYMIKVLFEELGAIESLKVQLLPMLESNYLWRITYDELRMANYVWRITYGESLLRLTVHQS